MICKICDYDEPDKKRFSNHLRKEHGLSSREYTRHYLCNDALGEQYDGICAADDCQSFTRYVSFTFKRYCKDHARLAMKESGARGGKAPAWNKGKTKQDDDRIAAQANKVSATGNPFFGHTHSDATRAKIRASKRIDEATFKARLAGRINELICLTAYADYRSRQQQYLDVRCVVCGFEDKKTLQAFERGSLCHKCHPNTESQAQLEILEWIRSLDIEAYSDKKALSGKELDIYVPSHNFAIEYNGLYWHSELNAHKSHLREKTDLALSNNINVLHLFSDEWRDKQSICKSMVIHRLGLTPHRIHARACTVREISVKAHRAFLNAAHLAGAVNARYKFGLYHANKLVAVLSFRRPSSKAYEGRLEIARFACIRDTTIPGGFTKLLKYALDVLPTRRIFTYADLRVGQGKVYERAGFKHAGRTSEDYWYTDGVCRYHRLKYRAKDGVSERDIAKAAGMYRIYGCGSNIWQLS